MTTPTSAEVVGGINAAINLACDYFGLPHPDDTIAGLRSANAQLTSDLTAANGQIGTQTSTIGALTSERDALRTKVTTLQNDIAGIKTADVAEDAAVAKAEGDAA